MLRSLRARLTAGLTAVLAVILAAAGLVAANAADESERAALDDRLRRTAELSRATAIAAVEDEVPQGDDRLDAVLAATGSSLRLVLGDVALLDTGTPPKRRPAGGLPGGLSTFEAGGERYRAYVTALRDGELDGLTRLELTSSLTGLERRQATRRRRFVGLGIGAVLLGGAGVFLASGVVLRPLRRLQRVSGQVARDEDLERRVPEDDGPSEMRSLAASFNAMLARLSRSAADRERALAATRRFAADAGHELRTPLTSTQATLSSLARHPDLPAERRTRMAQDALDQHRRLVGLLDGLQALARGDVAPERSDLDLAEVADASLSAARERHPEVTWRAELPDAPVPVRGWEAGLRSLTDNLLENAVRHGGGTVALQVRRGALVVQDDGPGIPPDQRDRVLEPFVRLEEDGPVPGSGLGLALVAQQAAHHGAALVVDESPDLGGARFSVVWAE